MNKEKLLKLAAFIEKLPKGKLDMNNYAKLNGSKKLDAKHCKSAACALGWATVVFPRGLQLRAEAGAFDVYSADGNFRNEAAASEFFDLEIADAESLFGPAMTGYRTPKQVARGIRRYVKDRTLP